MCYTGFTAAKCIATAPRQLQWKCLHGQEQMSSTQSANSPAATQVNKGICKAVLHVHHVVMEASQAVLLIAAFCTCITVGVLLNPQGCSKS